MWNSKQPSVSQRKFIYAFLQQIFCFVSVPWLWSSSVKIVNEAWSSLPANIKPIIDWTGFLGPNKTFSSAFLPLPWTFDVPIFEAFEKKNRETKGVLFTAPWRKSVDLQSFKGSVDIAIIYQMPLCHKFERTRCQIQQMTCFQQDYVGSSLWISFDNRTSGQLPVECMVSAWCQTLSDNSSWN